MIKTQHPFAAAKAILLNRTNYINYEHIVSHSNIQGKIAKQIEKIRRLCNTSNYVCNSYSAISYKLQGITKFDKTSNYKYDRDCMHTQISLMEYLSRQHKV